jgi:hypothetical protein
MGAYSNYEAAPSQDPYYQNGNYDGVTPTQFGAPAAADSYGQGYGTYEGALEIEAKYRCPGKHREPETVISECELRHAETGRCQ